MVRRETRSRWPLLGSLVAWLAAPSPAAAQTGDPIEVTVQGETAPESGVPRARESRVVPGTFGDALRAVETLPGIAPTASGLPYFYVRGAPPANSGYFIDGIPVPLLFHVGPGPSVLSPGLVDHVDFFPGSPPARYGGYLGGVIAAETREPSTVRRVEYGARTFDANALVEAPVGPDTTALVSGRYGYPNLLLDLIRSSVSVDYWDYAARVSHRLSPRDSVSVLAFGARDQLHDDLQERDLFAASVHRVDLRYDRRLEDGALRLAATMGYDLTGQGVPGRAVNDEVRSLGPGLRFEWSKRVGEALDFRSGFRASSQQADYGGGRGRHHDADAGVYLDVSARPTRRLELSPGVRFHIHKAGEATLAAADPRLAIRYQVSERLHWVVAGSVAHQPPTYVIPVPGLDFDVERGLQRTAQVSVGSELTLPSRFLLSLTGFYGLIDNATDYVSGCGQRSPCSVVDRVSGRTYGIEILLKRPITNRFSGWISYTLARAERTFEGYDYLSPFDRTQSFAGVGTYNFGSGYRAGFRATYYSGRPEVPVIDAQGLGGAGFAFRRGDVAQHRLPDFYRLDLRADKSWMLGDSGAWISLVLEFFNVTLTKEATNWTCDFSGNCTTHEVGPVALPSIGIEGAL
jgi:hypothetical protein